MYTIYSIFLIAILIFGVVLTASVIVGCIKSSDTALKVMIISVIFLIIAAIGGFATEGAAKRELVTKYINQGYTLYVDGVKVDPDNVYVKYYRIHIDDEQHKILAQRG